MILFNPNANGVGDPVKRTKFPQAAYADGVAVKR